MGRLYVVRHADAGSRSAWDGPDALRPLSPRGRRQAGGLAAQLADAGVSRLVSSPFTRCVETLLPLGQRLGLEVEVDERLGENQGALGALALADELAKERAAICSHGDVIPDLLDELLRQGIKLADELRWQKASTWVLSRDGGRLAKGRYVPPPA
ncbi:MAG: phosphoglycerate mutase family protein [Acidimicrobiales bacterium]|nr:phosphoglycerate mutase family protein [Acidimicrobiales bacterium]